MTSLRIINNHEIWDEEYNTKRILTTDQLLTRKCKKVDTTMAILNCIALIPQKEGRNPWLLLHGPRSTRRKRVSVMDAKNKCPDMNPIHQQLLLNYSVGVVVYCRGRGGWQFLWVAFLACAREKWCAECCLCFHFFFFLCCV
jgi:hypothetical protein